MNRGLITPANAPDHHTVGRHFKAWDGLLYWCDSYDPQLGYWMTGVDAPPERVQDQNSEWRRNVSERAIGRTYHVIHVDIERPHRAYCEYGWMDSSVLLIPRSAAVLAPATT